MGRLWSEGGGKKEEVVHFVSKNIQNSRNGGVKLALHGMAQANTDLGILKETNITGGVYNQESTGFHFIALDASIRHCGGILLFYK